MNALRNVTPRTLGAWLGWIAGGLVLGWIVFSNLPQAYPELPSHQTFRIVFPPSSVGATQPLVTTGSYGNGDFLAVRYLDADTAVFVYDVWGMGGPVSPPFALEPGKTRTFDLEMPTLATVRDFHSHEQRPLRIALDGREILSAAVYFHRRAPDEIYFATNPIGGTTVNESFRGELATPDGRALRGPPQPLMNRSGQLARLVAQRPWFVCAAGLAAIAVGFATRAIANRIARQPAPRSLRGHEVAPHRWAAATIIFCAVVFAALVTGGTFRFIYEDSFGTFYDYQAAGLLQGRLDVPQAALGGEAFVVGGKTYGYFGVTPALLRVPFVAMNVAFGKIIRPFLLAYFIAALVAAYALLCQATRRICGPAAWPSRWATVAFLLGSGLGSTLLFLGSRAYIYHEAILCGVAFTLWTIFFALRYLGAPAARSWIGALICGLLAVHARPSVGLFALCSVGAVALIHARANLASTAWSEFRRHLAIGALAALALLSFNGLSYLKFGTFDGSPLRYSVQYTPERLAHFDGRNFHVANLPHNLDAYFLRPDLTFEPRFPYFFFVVQPNRVYPHAKIDLAEPTLALPFAMPALCAMAIIGGAWVLRYAPSSRRPLAALAMGAVPMTLALLTAIVTSHRYTGDFCPLLIAASAWGLAAFDGEAAPLRRGLLALTSVLTAGSIILTLALSLHFQGDFVWGVPAEVRQNYQHLRASVDEFFGPAHRR